MQSGPLFQQLVQTKLDPRARMNRQPHGWLAASESTHMLVLLSCCVLGFLCKDGMALAQLAHTANLPPENYAIRKLAGNTVAHQAPQANGMFAFPSTKSAKGESQSSILAGEQD